MPTFEPYGTRPVRVRPAKKRKPKANPKPKRSVRVKSTAPPQSPDSRDNNRRARHPVVSHVSPDAQDVAGRSTRQKIHDENYAQAVQDAARGKRPELVKQLGLHPERAKKTRTKRKKGHGAGPLFAAVSPAAYVRAITHGDFGGMGVVKGAAHVAGAAGKDAAELAVTTPSSVVHLADTAIHHPKKLPGELAAPYVELAKHPGKSLREHPLQTALMVAPAVRMPGRIAGKAARVAGKQTLERPAATLPGTAVKEARTGSRDVFVRAAQSRHDRKHGAPTVTVKDVQRRVDEFHDAARHHEQHAERLAVKQARKAAKGQPKDRRREAATQAAEGAREQARADTEHRFVREFGTNVRLSTGAAERDVARQLRVAAVHRVGEAKGTVRAADVAHDEAMAAARAARSKAKRSPRLAALESRRRDAQRDLARAQRAVATARVGHGVARGRAQVLSRNIGGGGKAGGYGVQLAKGEVTAAGERVASARAAIRALDEQIAAERKRISGVPPTEHQALVSAIHARGEARAELAGARARADAARRVHVNTKRAMSQSTLVSPAHEGRLFVHKADAATLVRKLNDDAQEGLHFAVRQVGEKYGAVPVAASKRLAQHHGVGSSKATMAKVMRRSRGAFTQAVLPLSPKWLAGQGVEAGIRATVAGAGPFDLMRFNKTVKRLNKVKPGAGDELRMRVTGGHFDLTGPARDFADGKSLADEFADTSLEKAGKVASAVGKAVPAKAVRHGWSAYTRAVLGAVNGAVEQTARKAMAGQAIKNSPLIEKHIIGLTDKAIEDAARGLKHTENQVALGRAVDRMYGKYQKFSPDKRSLLLHWTPFLPWYMNVGTFLLKVLPVDHPVTAALVADINAAEEDWRKTNHLSLLEGNHVPDFLLGSVPTKGGGSLRVAHYTPFGIGTDLTGSVASLALPQAVGPGLNMLGIDWKGDQLKDSHGKPFNQGQRALRAFVSALEAQAPGVSQAGAISGVTPRYVDRKDEVRSPGEVLRSYLPTTPSKGIASKGGVPVIAPVRVKPLKVKPAKIKISR